jgi:hypothetical protein
MPREKLRRLLNRLHEELTDAPPMDDTERAMLRDIAEDIRSVLSAEGDLAETATEPNLTRSLGEATAQFEASHPRLVSVLTQISDLLRSIGIS